MVLPSDLISQFVKATKDDEKKPTNEMLYGTIVYDGKPYVRLDGSDLLTPVSTTANIKDGERVTVSIQNHSAVVTGNVSSPSASSGDVKEVMDEMAEFEILMAYKISTDELTAIYATIEKLIAASAQITDLEAVYALIETIKAKYAELENVSAEDLEAISADIEQLRAMFAEFDDVSAEHLAAVYAEIDNLVAYNAEFTYVSAEHLTAIKAEINELDVTKLSAEEADLRYVNIDLANIDKAWFEEFYAKSGIIEYMTSEDLTVTGHIVGVTITGDLIEGGTIKADKLIVKGEDGIYYKLNFESGNFTSAEEVPTDGLHGSVIVASSVTADKISVSDLVAFGATIAGFHIVRNDDTDLGAIYSGVKETVDNSTRGMYMDSIGQLALGDSTNFLRYYKVVDEEGNDVLDDDGNQKYKLEISADSILFGSSTKDSVADLKALTEHVKIGTYIEPETGDSKPSVELSESDSDVKLRLTNATVQIADGENVSFSVRDGKTSTEQIEVKEELQFPTNVTGDTNPGMWIWSTRANGNFGCSWKEVSY